MLNHLFVLADAQSRAIARGHIGRQTLLLLSLDQPEANPGRASTFRSYLQHQRNGGHRAYRHK